MKIKNTILFILFFLTVGFFYSVNSYGGEPVAVFGDWVLFKTTNNHRSLLCYMVSIPQQRYDNFSKRGQSFFNVITEKDKEDRTEIYLSFGQVLNKKIVKAELDIAKRKFPIFVYDDKAWAYNLNDDRKIIEELKKSTVFSVAVEYSNNKQLIDIYSLNGFSEAYEELLKMCK